MRSSDYFNVNTSYFKLRNIQLGYALSSELIQKIKLQRVRMYLMAENLFLVKKGVLYTPPTGAAILAGITRDSILQLGRQLGYEVREQALPREALYVCDEAFFTGTACEITPIRSIDGLQIGNGGRGPITAEIQDAFFGLFNGSTHDAWGWLEHVGGGEIEVQHDLAAALA